MKKIITLGMVGALSLATTTLATQGIWTTKTSMPTPRMYLSTSVVDGRIYAIGGSAYATVTTAGTLRTVEEYDPIIDIWTARSPMPTARWGLSTCTVNGKIYAIGGARVGVSPLRTVEEYDAATDTWTTKSPMPTARWGLATGVVGGKIYAVGGMISAGFGCRIVEEYDPGTNTWTTKAPMNLARYAPSACAVNGKVYVLGGTTQYPNVTATVEEYDPERDTWTMKGSLLGAKTYFSTSEMNGRIHAIGGAPHPDNATAIVYEYDPLTGTSTAKPNLLNRRTLLSTSAAGGRIYAIGGSTSGLPWTASGLVEEHVVIPSVDFNADGKVDAADLALLVADWGKNNSVCDIGPFPWGDGVVDERDLKVLMESLMTPGPKAAEVPCDVVLSWVSPSIAKSSDIYLGTSFEAVNMATRDDPCDVLVSWGQKETTYAPDAPLEFGRTYYWRIDTVLGLSTTSICKGPVLSFTTESFAYPIKNITAGASSFQIGMGPEKTVDGSGLDQSDGHSTNPKDMWCSQNTGPHWIQYQFDQVYALHEMWVWNQNQMAEPHAGLGAKTVKIEYSTDGTTWVALADVPEFAKALGKAGYVHDTTVSFDGVSAKYVKLIIEKAWGTAPTTGLSEVRFFHIPDRSTINP